MIAPPCESPFAGRVVFVLGSRRCGTTWLAEMLLAHPEIGGMDATVVLPDNRVPNESVIFGAVVDVWRNACRSDAEGLCDSLGFEGAVAAIRRFCDRMFVSARDRYSPGSTWFLEKTPDNAKRLPIVAAIYPDAWYVEIVRDGRDMARSLTSVHFGPDDVGEAAAEWTRDVIQVERHRWRVPRFRQVRYEDLLISAADTVADLYQWMGLNVDADVRKELDERAGRRVATYGSTDPVGSGKWREMSAEDITAVLTVAGDQLASLGYLDGEDAV